MSVGRVVGEVEGGRAAERALGILERMEMLSGERPDLVRDTIGYTSVICAFARSGMREGGNRAEELFRRSLSLYYGEEEGGGGLGSSLYTQTQCPELQSGAPTETSMITAMSTGKIDAATHDRTQ